MQRKIKQSLRTAGYVLLTAAVLSVSLLPAAARERQDRSSPTPEYSHAVTIRPGTVGAITPEASKYVRYKKRENADTIGWLTIPDTRVNSVVVHRPTSRNIYYGERDFQGNLSKNGTYYTDYRNTFAGGTRQGLSRNTVIFGHSWNDDPNSILFSQIKKYRDPEFAKNHPYIFFSTEQDDIAWEVFAVMDTHINFPYILSNGSLGYSVEDMLEATRKSSIYNYKTSVSSGDKILTISTCTYSIPGQAHLPEDNDYRFAIVAKQVDPNTIAKSQADFTINPNPAHPDTYDPFRKLTAPKNADSSQQETASESR